MRLRTTNRIPDQTPASPEHAGALDGSRQAVIVHNDFKMSIPPPGGTGAPAFQRDVKKATEIAFCRQR